MYREYSANKVLNGYGKEYATSFINLTNPVINVLCFMYTYIFLIF